MQFRKSYLPVEAIVPAMESYLQSYHADAGYDVVVYPYQNGRENGFTFSFQTDECYLDKDHYWNFSVAENRNSDEIVIRPGVHPDWHLGMSEDDSHAAVFIPSGEYKKAVIAIMAMVGSSRVPQTHPVGPNQPKPNYWSRAKGG